MKSAKNWKDYSVIATGDGYKLERWGKVVLLRPDPQVIWKSESDMQSHPELCAKYLRSSSGGGGWEYYKKMPDEWTINYGDLKFSIKPMGFKHTGLFPEQAFNWDVMTQLIKNANRPINVLNLFAYTGGATVACLAAGASVCHVDAAKGMVERAGENVRLSGLKEAPVRYIIDDCKKFVQREIKRGRRYDAIIMDPPSYGRGPSGEIWKLEDDIDDLVRLTSQLISESPLFVLINSYTTGLSSSTVGYLLELHFKSKLGGCVTSDEIGIPVTASGAVLPSGSSARWEI